MNDFKAIIKLLKLYLKSDKNVKIYDKDVAMVLGITQMNFATIKKRNTIPYENILIFCKKEGICCDNIFFNSNYV